eukprot:Amastigsp_a72_6.p1 type:complete len:359 gc:universal Amastigsp_a72_6:1124-48(-)
MAALVEELLSASHVADSVLDSVDGTADPAWNSTHMAECVMAELASLTEGYDAKLVRGVLSTRECHALIEHGLAVGLRDVACGYRTSTRTTMFSKPLAELLFDRIRAFVPQTVTLAPDNSHPSCLGLTGTSGADGVWELASLNPMFRLCKYEAGGKFDAHYDGQFAQDDDNASFYTAMVYLNGGPEAPLDGGATRFFDSPENSVAVLAAVAPEQGMLILFPHRLYHDGAVLHSGEKFIFRTDVMYRRRPGTRAERDPKIERALRAEQLAAEAETRGDMAEAMRQLRIAAKLNPESVCKPKSAQMSRPPNALEHSSIQSLNRSVSSPSARTDMLPVFAFHFGDWRVNTRYVWPIFCTRRS